MDEHFEVEYLYPESGWLGVSENGESEPIWFVSRQSAIYFIASRMAKEQRHAYRVVSVQITRKVV